MVYLSSIVWIVESFLVINIILLILGLIDGDTVVTSIIIIIGFEIIRYATNNFGTKPREDIWWNQIGCDSWVCNSTACSDTSCSDLGCDAFNDIECDGLGELGCETISEMGCDGLASSGCDALSGCDCDCG